MTPLCVVFFHVSVRAGCTCLDVGFTIVVVNNNNALSVHQVGAQVSVIDRSVPLGARRSVHRTRPTVEILQVHPVMRGDSRTKPVTSIPAFCLTDVSCNPTSIVDSSASTRGRRHRHASALLLVQNDAPPRGPQLQQLIVFSSSAPNQGGDRSNGWQLSQR